MPGDKPEVIPTDAPTTDASNKDKAAPTTAAPTTAMPTTDGPKPKGGKKDDDEALENNNQAPKKAEPKKDEPQGGKKDDKKKTETEEIAELMNKIASDVNDMGKMVLNKMKPGDDPLADGDSDELLNEVDPAELRALEGEHDGPELEAPGGTKKDPMAALSGTDMTMDEGLDEEVEDDLVTDLESSMQKSI